MVKPIFENKEEAEEFLNNIFAPIDCINGIISLGYIKPIDYRALLKKYVKEVVAEEGCIFDGGLTVEEQEELGNLLVEK